jgi:D-alanyl-D-alanine carboxypeptidase
MSNLKKPILKVSRKAFYTISSIIIIVIAIIGLILILINNRPVSNPSGNVKGASIALPDKPQIDEVPIRNKDSKDPYIQARRYALIDADTGTLLYGQNQNEKVPIASVTKVMTATIVLENYNLADIIQVSPESANSIGSVMGLKPDEKISTLSLLNGLLIPSGNDAAYTLAEHYGSLIRPHSNRDQSIQAFVAKMNDKAKELGMTNTHYLDPAGLNDEATSTARDQGYLLSYAIKNKTFAQIVHKPNAIITSSDGQIIHNLDSSDRLVKQDSGLFLDGVIGGKTGFTPESGHNLETVADINGHKLVAVILSTYSLDADASAIQARALLTWGYNNYTWQKLY